MEESCSGQPGRNNGYVRDPVAAGLFYPAEKHLLEDQLSALFSTVRHKPAEGAAPLALILPHAGFQYSGEVAASGVALLDKAQQYKHIFLIGSSHTAFFNGASIYTLGDFSTPLGTVPVDPLATELVDQHQLFTADPKPHMQEHCLEVILPFLQYHLEEPFSIIPMVIGTNHPETCRAIASILQPYFTGKNLFIISSDFSHYPTYSQAQEFDRKMASAITTNSPDKFLSTKWALEKEGREELATAMCGWTSALTLLYITEHKKGIGYKPIRYMNSGDQSGDTSRVVGYWSIALYQQNAQPYLHLTLEDKSTLLTIARKAIEDELTGRHTTEESLTLSPNIRVKAGAFVTLRRDGKLRGCIGNFSGNQPLYKTVQSMAVAAATGDYRFEPVTRSELNLLTIEISVLTPLRPIDSIDSIELGKHGIYIKRGVQSGTFLPQVAIEAGWTVEEFVGHCSRDKAGIGWDGWREGKLYVYETISFDESTEGSQ